MKAFVAAGVFLSLMCSVAFAESEAEKAAAIRNVVSENLQASESEDIDAAMATLHSQSPGYQATKKMLISVFEAVDVKYEILTFNYLGSDDEYATARIIQATTGATGKGVRDNDVDMIMVFKKEAGRWKLWSQVILEIRYHDEE